MAKVLCGVICIFLGFQTSKGNRFIPQIPEECVDQTICENVPNYPHDYAEGIIQELVEQSYMWQHDDTDSLQSQPDGPSTGNNIVDLCPSKVVMATPLAAKDVKGKWHFVLNRKTAPAFQKFRLEVCKTSIVNQTCGKDLQKHDIHVNSYSGYPIQCKQQYLHRVLSCLDENGKVKELITTACSCCSCAVFENKIEDTATYNYH